MNSINYYKQERSMCIRRVTLGLIGSFLSRLILGYTGNPMTIKEAKEHLKSTKSFIQQNPDLYL
jgi:hypothetical protein